MKYYLAVDLGATSGRHLLGHLENGKLVMEEIYRFHTHSTQKNESWIWQSDVLTENIIKGMEACKSAGKIPCMMAVDSFGAEFVLLDKAGGKLCDCVEYRNDGVLMQMVSELQKQIPYPKLYRKTGITSMPFDTIYQLLAFKMQHSEILEKADKLLMLPCYINYRLTGVIKEEYTIATSTGLINAQSRTWDMELVSALGLPNRLFSEIHMPGEIVGTLTDEIKNRVGFDCPVVLPAAHDTASAYFAAPISGSDTALISSGTWNLLGIRSDAPIITPEAMQTGFSNEGAYPEHYKILKIIIGFYMIEIINNEFPNSYDYEQLQHMAAEADEIKSVINMRNLMYLTTPNMIDAIKKECAQTHQQVPQSEGQILRVVFRSMAQSYKDVLLELEKITGRKFKSLHIVGGGSRNEFVNSLTAEITGLPVYAGPVEAAVIGNILCQMLASKELSDIGSAVEIELKSFPIKKFE